MFSCRSLWSEKGLQAQNVKGFSGDLLPTLPDGASAFPFFYSFTASARGAFCGSFSPFRVLQVPASSVGLALIGSSLSQPGHRPSRQGLVSHLCHRPAHRRFRGGPSLHLKRYSRKEEYIVCYEATSKQNLERAQGESGHDGKKLALDICAAEDSFDWFHIRTSLQVPRSCELPLAIAGGLPAERVKKLFFW
jgi:hypothetical protein